MKTEQAMTIYPHKEFAVRDLRVGDVVKQFEGPFGTAIVRKVTADSVTFFRPYGTTAGFVYGGGQTICYHGMEETTFALDSKAVFHVYQRDHEEKPK